jgi:hypothetical protein
MQGKPEKALDYMGALPANAARMWPVFLALAAGLLVVALAGRRRQILM